MLPRGLIIATLIGMAAGAIVGAFLVTQKNNEQLEFVSGLSLSIVTEKLDYTLGEAIPIKIVNSGTHTITFSDASFGLEISSLTGRVLYSPSAAQVVSTLEPKEEISLVWDQIKNDGDAATAGTYKITTTGFDGENAVQKSVTINIHK